MVRILELCTPYCTLLASGVRQSSWWRARLRHASFYVVVSGSSFFKTGKRPHTFQLKQVTPGNTRILVQQKKAVADVARVGLLRWFWTTLRYQYAWFDNWPGVLCVGQHLHIHGFFWIVKYLWASFWYK